MEERHKKKLTTSNKKKIGIILDSHPHSGGSYQYAMCLLEAVYNYASMKCCVLCAFYIQTDWEKILEEYPVIKKRISGSYIVDIKTIDDEGCLFVIGTSQTGWSGRLVTPVAEPIHDLMHRYMRRFPEVSESMEGEKRDILYSSIVRNAIGIFVDSEVGKEHVLESYGRCHEENIYVLPFVAPQYLCDKTECVDLPFEKYFFYPAQFWNHKNHKNLILAVDKLNKQGITVNFVFVGGKKNNYDDVLSLISELKLENQICVMDYVSNSKMRFLYENARALVMPTFFGPTNIPPLEAIFLQCPVAVSGIFGMPGQLKDAAIYFDPNDIDDISEVLYRLWTDNSLCEELINNGRKMCVQYTQERFNQNFVDIAEDLIGKALQRSAMARNIRDFCCGFKRIYIYGAGEYAYRSLTLLRRLHIKVCALLVSDVNSNDTEDIFDKCIYNLSDVNLNSDDGIICAVSDVYKKEVLSALLARNIGKANIFEISEDNIIYLQMAYIV